MSATPLPVCRHRGPQFVSGRWTCSSPKLIIPARIVTAEVCTTLCPCVDHPIAPRCPSKSTKVVAASFHDAVAARQVALDPDLISIGIITAPRGVCTLELTVAELRRGGFPQTIRVFAEPKTPIVSMPGVALSRHRRRHGLWHNWLHAARTMLAETKTPFVLLCEDDVALSPAAAWALQHAIDTLPHEDWGYASLYTPWHNLARRPKRPPHDWVAMNHGGRLWGALAYCFTRQGLRALLRHKSVRESPKDSHTDWVVSDTLRSMGHHCYFHLPSLGDHVGQGVSAAAHVSVSEMIGAGYERNYRRYVPKLTQKLEGKLAVVCTVFSPSGYPVFYANYARFINGLHSQGVDVWTLEIAFGDRPFQLARGDRSLRVRTRDVLWQQERAYNYLLAKLPRQYDKVAWVDADLLFTNRRWARDAASLLNQYPLVQCFTDVNHLAPGGAPQLPPQPGLAKIASQRGIDGSDVIAGAPGYAWAGRRQWLARHGLYDRVVVGGSDAAMIAGWYNWWGHPAFRSWPPDLLADVHRWAKRAWSNIQGQVGFVEGDVLHLYHGPLANRGYEQRYAPLCSNAFDPARDLRLGPNGLWQWASRKPRLHRAVREYFERRRDDDGTS